MTFDLSHLYKTSVLNLGAFKVTVQEIPHGRYSDSQSDMLAKINLDDGMSKKSIDKGMVQALKTKALSLGEFSDAKTIAGIQSWTLKDANQNEVPVCIEAYRALPHAITEQIEEGIKALNPTLEDDFPSES
jgi:hypothetical protein